MSRSAGDAAAASSGRINALFQGVDKESSGYKLLASMGWQEGEGLGAQKQGITTHVRVKKKDGALGVGAAEQASRLRDWTTGMFSYETILSGLKAVVPQHAESPSSDDETEPALAPATIDKAAHELIDGKVARSASKGASGKGLKMKPAARKRKSAEAAVGMDTEAAAMEVKRVKLATHVGRYQKRERAKRVGGYSSADLAAILGAPSTDIMFKMAPVQAASTVEHSGVSSADEGDDAVADACASDRLADAEKAIVPCPPPNAWWCGLFVMAGRMGSVRTAVSKDEPKIRVNGFREADQECLYEDAQDKAAHGRQGLGRSGLPKKVAGARWCGTKTKIGDNGSDSAADTEAGGSGTERDEVEEETQQVMIVLPAKGGSRQPMAVAGVAQQQPEVGTSSSCVEAEAAVAIKAKNRIKWAKLARQVLADVPKRRLRVVKLQKRLLAAAVVADSASASQLTLDHVGKTMMKRLRRCAELKIDAKYVALVGSV